MDRPDLLREHRVGGSPLGAASSGLLPGVERRTGDLDGGAQLLHLEGVLVVGNELEAAHQFVSPAKYFAADLKISRSVESLTFSTSSSLTLASSRTSLAACDSALPGGDALLDVVAGPVEPVVVPVPRTLTHWPTSPAQGRDHQRCP